MSGFTHFDEKGNAVMVDVHEKADTYRVAVAQGTITVNEEVFQAITNHTAKKGDVLGIARIAGIMGAKKNAELIPLCHIIALTDCEIEFVLDEKTRQITATCRTSCVGKTGVEMEAMTGVSVALLTIYDMCKAMDRGMVISEIHLVEKMGGTIQVESVRGEGTTFTFRLPFTVSETAASETTTVGGDISDLLRDRKILLVEDNEINMEIAQFYLEEAGAKVEKAWNGQEAVALFSQNPAGSFDAILMDVMMPVMDGMEATQRIRGLKREDAASIPIIAMTAQTTADIRETCRKAGMDDYIAKPIREEELAKVIRKSWKAKKV